MLSVALTLVSFILSVHGAPEADLVTNLPGVTFEVSFKHYSGYLTASDTHQLHYWLLESQNDPAHDPIVLWMNGGPGCSSLGGLMTELGPFWPNKDGMSIFENVFAWNKVANVLFLEAPAGVGFSYALDNNTATSDNQTADENYVALKDFFNNKFPEYKNRDFFVTGESYCGVYIPTLTVRIVNGMLSGDFPTNLTGIAIGNGILSVPKQHDSVIKYMYYHGLIGTDDWNTLNTKCCPNMCSDNCSYYAVIEKVKLLGKNGTTNDEQECAALASYVSNTLLWDTDNDEYDIYRDCYVNATKFMVDYTSNVPLFASTLTGTEKISARKLLSQPLVGDVMNNGIDYDSTDQLGGFMCYASAAAQTYLNQPAVKEALHIAPQVLHKTWTDCTNLKYTQEYPDLTDQVIYALQHSNIRMLIYNGDVDMVCNFLGDQWFAENLAMQANLQVVANRSDWMYRGQIAGYVIKYERVHQLTVKGAGHLVPQARGGPALQMITNFIQNNPKYSQPISVSVTPAPMVTSSSSTASPQSSTSPSKSVSSSPQSTPNATSAVRSMMYYKVMLFVCLWLAGR